MCLYTFFFFLTNWIIILTHIQTWPTGRQQRAFKSKEVHPFFYRQPYFDDRSASTLVFLSTAFYHSQPVQPNPSKAAQWVGRQVQYTAAQSGTPGVPSLSTKQRGLERARRLQWKGVSSTGNFVDKGRRKKVLATVNCYIFTFLVHCLTVLTSSDMTMSTHLVQGSLIFPICLFTMVSKAISGVKRPVLPDRERTSHRAK